MLEDINSPADLKAADPERYGELAQEIREFLIEKVGDHGGHLASNLGDVELTMALHLAFEFPEDKIVWDVGHQAYTHKLLTGRRDDFDSLREYKGMSGFPKRRESEYDSFDTGHSSTSISAALGLAAARDLSGGNYSVVAVIGDGAMSGGLAFEGLNNASNLKSNLVIILNDNQMSISHSTGSLARYLNRLRVGSRYNDLKQDVVNGLGKVPVVGDELIQKIYRSKGVIKKMMVPDDVFSAFDITYVGPVDGYNIKEMVRLFSEARKFRRPIIIHVKTKKGKGYAPAERHPDRFHGVGPFDPDTGKPAAGGKKGLTYTDVFSHELVKLAGEDEKIVAITAAMSEGTGLDRFEKAYPDRFFDVGIAEGHAVTFAAGMAAGGLKPVVAVYSTFLQRAYDQIVHDVCLQQLPVVFAVDRAGIVGRDGETHQGILDISYLGSMPGMTVIAPKNRYELCSALRFAVNAGVPVAVRYPRGGASFALKEHNAPFSMGKSELIADGSHVALIAVGNMVETAARVREMLTRDGISTALVNARFTKPVDYGMVDAMASKCSLVVTMEENVASGGFGESVASHIKAEGLPASVLNVSIPDCFVEQGSQDELRRSLGLDAESVYRAICGHEAVLKGSGCNEKTS